MVQRSPWSSCPVGCERAAHAASGCCLHMPGWCFLLSYFFAHGSMWPPAESPVCVGWTKPKEAADKPFSPVLPKDHDSVPFFWGIEIN